MKKILFILLILFSEHIAHAQTQIVTPSHESGEVPYGTIVSYVATVPGDTIYFEWGGRSITASSAFFVDSATFILPTPNEGDPYFAHFNTCASTPDMLDDWMGGLNSPYLQQDSDFLSIDSVWKINVLTLFSKTSGGVQRFSYFDPLTRQRHQDAPIISIILDERDGWNDTVGILVEGACGLNSQCFDRVEETGSAVAGSLAANSMDSIHVTDSLIEMFGFAVPDGNVDTARLHLYDSIMVVSITDDSSGMSFIFVAENVTGYFLDDSVYFSWPATYDTVTECIDIFYGDTCRPNFTIGGGEFQAYPELERSVYKKQASFFFYSDEYVYEHQVKLDVAGNSSRFHAANAFMLKTHKDHKFNYDLYRNNAPPKRTIYLRKFGSVKGWAPLNDVIVQRASKYADVGAQSGHEVIVYLNGEYWGVYWAMERDDRYYPQNHYNVDDDHITMYQINDCAEEFQPINNHRDSFWLYVDRIGLMNFLDTVDIQQPGMYQKINQYVDFDHFVKIQFSKAGFGNVDIGGNNVSFYVDQRNGILRGFIKDYDLSCFDPYTNHYDQYFWNRDTAILGCHNSVQEKIITTTFQNDTLRYIGISCQSDLRTVSQNTDSIMAAIDFAVQSTAKHFNANHSRWGMMDHVEPDSMNLMVGNVPTYVHFAVTRPDNIDSFFIQDFIDVEGVTDMYVRLRLPDSCRFNSEYTVWNNTIQITDTAWQWNHCYDVPRPLRSEDSITWLVNNDTMYGAEVWVDIHKDTTYYITAICECPEIDPNISSIILNEVVADNDSVIVDDEGKFEDYIELYNPTSHAVNLHNACFSDNDSTLEKFRVSKDLWIAPNNYLIIWADDDEEHGPNHASFKLAKHNEGVYLSDGATIIDSISWDTIHSNVALARCSDTWETQMPSPLSENHCGVVLGVNVIHFYVTEIDDYLQLSWELGGSADSTVVLRSTDMYTWDKIGTSAEYTLDDYDVIPEVTYYYQLAWVNDTSDVRWGRLYAATGLEGPVVTLLHNQAYIPDGYSLEVYNLLGQKVFVNDAVGYVDLPDDIPRIAHVYILRNKDTKEIVFAKKIIAH
jgi:hypothetical protein